MISLLFRISVLSLFVLPARVELPARELRSLLVFSLSLVFSHSLSLSDSELRSREHSLSSVSPGASMSSKVVSPAVKLRTL